jgi:hypothetical protein
MTKTTVPTPIAANDVATLSLKVANGQVRGFANTNLQNNTKKK